MARCGWFVRVGVAVRGLDVGVCMLQLEVGIGGCALRVSSLLFNSGVVVVRCGFVGDVGDGVAPTWRRLSRACPSASSLQKCSNTIPLAVLKTLLPQWRPVVGVRERAAAGCRCMLWVRLPS